jgi:flagellar L-ring protein precursor FlgH
MSRRIGRRAGALVTPALALALVIIAAPAVAQKLFDADTYRPLASDHKATHVGDILTIQVYEQSSASTTTDTNTQRNNGINANLTTLPSGAQYGGTLTAGGTFDGGGTTQRANKLLVTLSVSVREILPNGDLKVGGEQLLTVNQEQHKVAVQGRVRPQDISSDNVVLSTKLADAHIEYAGEGDLSDRQRRAWWRMAVDLLGL